jgi:hypothetical protein
MVAFRQPGVNRMTIVRNLIAFAAIALAGLSPAQAAVGYADYVQGFFDSGAGPIAGPYGGTFPGSFPVTVSTSVVLGSDGPIVDFLSLPTGSYVTVGFTDEVIFDQTGNDIFVQEVGGNGERANVFVTSDFLTYTFLGVAQDNASTAFDLATIGFTGQVLGVRIVGLDALGASPGFDVVNVQALAFVGGSVPEPAAWMMMILGFGAIGATVRRQRLVVLRRT